MLDPLSFDPWGILALIIFIGLGFATKVYKEKNIELKIENEKLKEALEYYKKNNKNPK